MERTTEVPEKVLAIVEAKQAGPPAVLRPKSLDEFFRLAEILASSDLVPKDYRDKPANVLVALQQGAEVGLHPFQALQSIAVINGRPCMWGDAVLGLVLASGELEDIQETDDGQTATCTVRRKGFPTPITRTFSQADADHTMVWVEGKRVPLSSKGVWAAGPKYATRMRQMRARSWTLRDAFADRLKGLHVLEEVKDIEPEGGRPSPRNRQDLATTLMPRKVGEPAPAVEPDPDTPPLIAAAPAVDPDAELREIMAAQFGEPGPPAPQPAQPGSVATAGPEAGHPVVSGGEAGPDRPGQGSTPPAPLRFTIGKTPYETAGITRQQMLWSFDLEPQIEKKQKGLTRVILKSFGAEHRWQLTEEQAEHFLIRLAETLGIDPPWITKAGGRRG